MNVPTTPEKNNNSISVDSVNTSGLPDPKNKSSAGSSAIRLVLVLVACMGFYNSFGDNKIVSYHNDFYKTAYNSVYVGPWNEFVEKVNGGRFANNAEAAEYLKSRIAKPLNEWIASGDTVSVPEFAAEFHKIFVNDMKTTVNKIDAFVKAVAVDPNVDSARYYKAIGDSVSITTKDGVDFQSRLKSEKSIEFEKTK